MKSKILKNALIAGALIFSGILTGWRYGESEGYKNAADDLGETLPRIEVLNGTTEFYFVPVDDNRLWHVINKYNTESSNDGPCYNMSSYTFSSDSVCVINEYVGLPEGTTGKTDGTMWDIGLSGLLSKNADF